MSVILKTKHWQIEPYNGGLGVFDTSAADKHGDACRVCVEEAAAGDLEAVMAIEMCGADGMLMGYWNHYLQEKAKCKPKA